MTNKYFFFIKGISQCLVLSWKLIALYISVTFTENWLVLWFLFGMATKRTTSYGKILIKTLKNFQKYIEVYFCKFFNTSLNGTILL